MRSKPLGEQLIALAREVVAKPSLLDRPRAGL